MEEEHFSNSSDDKLSLEDAFKYFEIDDPKEATREAVKKKFRRLSLVHHPDRNNQSQESVKEMQKINNLYEIMEQEFDRREGNDRLYNENIPEEPAENTTKPDPCDPDELGISKTEQKRRRKVHKRRRQKARYKERTEQERQQAEYKRRREEMEEEMHREWEEARRKMEDGRVPKETKRGQTTK
ncbi:unnamed protein product [Cylindrotheca closterium]|uniref:J domain-containing protein n=1 Tax=Cylindrotheca closterium TaxID=2856 RepID=A0AAD2D054_9STRA|nr:unnamed protein product [Cylindrotheca closterium]